MIIADVSFVLITDDLIMVDVSFWSVFVNWILRFYLKPRVLFGNKHLLWISFSIFYALDLI